MAKPSPFEQAQFDADVEQLFDILFQAMESGKISPDRVEGFFPTEVKERGK